MSDIKRVAMNTEHNDQHKNESVSIDHRWFEGALPAYALRCLEDDEANRVASHLDGCGSCRQQLRGYERTVGMLAYGVPQVEPPDGLQDRLLRRIKDRSDVRSIPEKKMIRPRSWLFQRFSPAFAMAGLVIIISLSVVNVIQWRQTRMLDVQLSAPLKIIKMRGSVLAPHADGTFVVGPDHSHGVLVASDLPAVKPMQVFQLWLIRDGRKDSAGTFTTTPAGYAVMKVLSPRPLTEYQSSIVTIEPIGGSISPTSPEMMSGVFDFEL